MTILGVGTFGLLPSFSIVISATFLGLGISNGIAGIGLNVVEGIKDKAKAINKKDEEIGKAEAEKEPKKTDKQIAKEAETQKTIEDLMAKNSKLEELIIEGNERINKQQETIQELLNQI